MPRQVWFQITTNNNSVKTSRGYVTVSMDPDAIQIIVGGSDFEAKTEKGAKPQGAPFIAEKTLLDSGSLILNTDFKSPKPFHRAGIFFSLTQKGIDAFLIAFMGWTQQCS